jgi:hypothetical protein
MNQALQSLYMSRSNHMSVFNLDKGTSGFGDPGAFTRYVRCSHVQYLPSNIRSMNPDMFSAYEFDGLGYTNNQ